MENLIQLQNGSKSFGSKTLFEEGSFSINEGEHVGVIGPNGAGKTTLFKILIRDEVLDEGQVVRSRRLKLGYLSQHDQWEPNETIESFVARDSLMPIWELKSFAGKLGLEEDHFDRPMSSLSGGYRMRAKLLNLIGKEPNLMLLDEPTNYLDLETLLVLEKFLQGYEGAFLLISHDREFLRRTTNHILEVESGSITKYNGNIDDYFEQKQLIRTQLEAHALSQQEKRKEILDFVARFGAKATKASQAQSRLKSLNKMETIEIKPLPVSAKIKIPAPARVGKLVLTLKNAQIGYGDRTILKGVNLQLTGGDHLAIVGLNGAGKSTLLKAVAGELKPQTGSVEYGYEATFGYYAQHVAESLEDNDTVFSALERKAHPQVLPQDVLDLAGALLFSGAAVKKPIRVLSGGERSRVALGQVLLQKASCLILDEPTNHLDFQTVEAMTQALQAFTGSLIVVSHDRSFIRRIGTKILEINHGKVGTYPGTYDDYVWSLEKGNYSTLQHAEEIPQPAAPPRKESTSSPAVATALTGLPYKEKKKSLDRRRKQLDTLMNQLDQKLAKFQEQLSLLNTELTASPPSATYLKVQEMGKVQKELDACELLWIQAGEEKEKVQKELQELL